MANLRKLAMGRECTVQIFNICNHNPETTVLAHLNGGGTGTKHHDILGCWACSDCHQWLDGGYVTKGNYNDELGCFVPATRKRRDYEHWRAIIRTQEILLKEGKISVQ